MKTKLVLSLALTSLFVQGVALAGSDSCDDYFQRHNKADLVPLNASAVNVPRNGDLPGYQSLDVLVQNTGNQPILGPTSGIIAANQIFVGVGRFLNGNPKRPLPPAVYRGWLSTPMAGGARTTVSVNLPTGSIENCATVKIYLDRNRTAGQHGCQCYANDTGIYTVHIRGQRRCDLTVPTKPVHPLKP